ncbi:class I SAM-dependent methyltransferase [bacterium AH-315-K03]|nr:class I SAM-dependent methyltransferase [bacterium AH-315-K03]
MSITSFEKRNVNYQTQATWWDRLAKKGLVNLLKKMSVGRLVIEDNGEIVEFGESVEQARLVAHVVIHHSSCYRDMLFGGSIGAAEAYMQGHWSTSNLLDVIRLMVLNLDVLNKMDSDRPLLSRISSKIMHKLNANTQNGSRKNISAHYDLGNDFFSLFLDPTMMYSSAIFPSTDASLEQASLFKLDTICRKLRLCEDDHLMEIGTGWGGLSIHAAKNYGCKVTTTTISKEQYDYACEAVKREGLEDKITLLLKDYRSLEGSYDKLVSIEMIEAVGHEYYPSYFEKCSNLIKSDGLMLIQAITIADQRYFQAKHTVDFIQRYIFPGGCLPSNEIISHCIRKYTDMQMVALQDIGFDYGKTLAEWRKRFHEKINQVKAQGYDDAFCRMWEYYLCYCEGGFAERAISTAQFVFAKPAARALLPL